MKSQASALTAVLENWQDVENAIGIYANSAGSALRENEIYLDSWEAKSNAVSAAWNEFVNTFLSSDMFKGFLDNAQHILNFLTEINGAIPIMAGLLTGVFTAAMLNSTITVEGFNAAMIKANLLSGGLPILIGLATTIIAGLISWGVSASDTAKQIENLTNKIDEQQQAIDELNAKEQEATNMYKEYASLMSKSNAYGLTAAEKEKLLDISTQLVDKYGLEVQGIDALTGAYIIGTDAINGYVEALRAERLEKQEEQNKTRDKRIKKNFKLAESNINPNDIDTYITNAKKYYKQVKDIPYEKQDHNFIQAFQESTRGYDGLDNGMQIYLDTGNISAFENALYLSASKYTSAINSVIKDVLAQIQVDNADNINQSGENILTSMMQSILPNIDDLDAKKVKTIKKKIEKFVNDENNGFVLDSLGAQNEQLQEQLNSNTVGLSDYKALLENQIQQLATINEIFGSNSQEAKIFKDQLNESSQNNIGLTFANISQFMADSKLDTTKFDNLATSILQLDKAMSNGKITFSEYIEELNKNISNISLEDTFKKNEDSAKQFFSTLTDKGQSAIQNLAAQMQNGEISQKDYLNGINDIIDYFDNLSNKSVSILGDSNDEEAQKTKKEISSSIGDLKSQKEELEGLMGVIQAIPETFEEYQNGGVSAVNNLTAALEAAGIQSLKLENETITGAENIAKAMQNNSQVFAAGQTEIATRTRNTLTQIGSGVGTVINGMIKLFDGVKISINPPKIGILDWIKGIVTGNKKTLDYEIKVNGSVDSKSIGNLFADSFGDVDWGFNGLNSGSSGPSGGYTAPQSDRSKVKSTSSPSQKETKETFNWIETALSRIQRKITNFGKTVSATWKSWTDRNAALKDQITSVNRALELQTQARARYEQQANSVALDENTKRLVREGAIDITTVDDNTADLIKEYQDWYEKILECDDAIIDLKDDLADLAQTKFDNLSKQFGDQAAFIDHEAAMLEATADLLDTRGYIASKSVYNSLIQNTQSKKDILQSQRSALMDNLNNSGIEKGTEAWNKMYLEILDLDEEILKLDNDTADYQNRLRELDWEVFDIIQEKISGITDETEFLMDLMSNDKMFNEDGSATKQGRATLGLHAMNYEVYMRQADDYAKEMQKIEAELANDPNNQKLQERKQELIELWRESALAAEDEKQSAKDLVSEGYDTLLDSMSKIIDKRKEMLSQVKDLYDYEKSIAEQTAEVSKYQKIINSMQGMADTEEGQAMLQKYELSLKEAKENLEETEYDKYISDQERLLDNLYDEAEEWLNQRLDDLDTIISEVIESTNNSASMINDTLKEEVEKVGGTLTAEMESIWNTENGSSVISKYSEQFEDKMTTVNKTLEAIKNFVEQMAKGSDEAANETISTATPSTPATSPAAPASPPPAQAPVPKSITIGGQINAGGAPIYTQAGGTKGYSQYFKKDPIYTVVGEKNGYLLVRHHSLSNGYTGWFRRSDVTAYKTGGLVNETGFAWLDGTKENPEMVLNAKDTKNFIALRDALSNLAQNHMFHMIHSNPKLPSLTSNAANQNVTAYNGDVHIELPNINNAQEFAEQFKEIYDKNVGKTRTMLQTDMFSKNNLEYRRYL